jgi:flavin reductase (DIM6/NTAB) family NADH-FMN oxidoreductase RutF
MRKTFGVQKFVVFRPSFALQALPRRVNQGHDRRITKPAGVRAVSVDIAAFKHAMRHLCAPVNIVATEHEGARFGLTVSAVNSLTATPPRLLACINIAGRSFRAISAARCMSVNVLAEDQSALARRFAGQTDAPGDDPFAGAHWDKLETQAPALVDAVVVFDCTVADMFVTHTHAIVIGDVRAVRVDPSRAPLLYFDGTFCSPNVPLVSA